MICEFGEIGSLGSYGKPPGRGSALEAFQRGAYSKDRPGRFQRWVVWGWTWTVVVLYIGGFHKWGYPKMDGLFSGQSIYNG